MAMKLVGAAALGLLLFAGCNRYAVSIHTISTPSEHFVVIESGGAGSERVLDCYSKPNGSTWDPTCKEVIVLED